MFEISKDEDVAVLRIISIYGGLLHKYKSMTVYTELHDSQDIMLLCLCYLEVLSR